MEMFKFEKSDIDNFIKYELKTLDKFKEPLNYVIKNLERLGHSLTIKSLEKVNFNKVKEHEGKSYYWSVFNYKNVTLVIRRYKQHLTIFTKVDKEGNKYGELKVEYGAFTLNTDFDKFGEDKHDEMMDKYYDKPFIDLNVIAKDLFNLLLEKDSGVHWVWNSVSLKRPDHVKIELIFDSKSISSLDNFVFCMEELESIYLSLFSENTMFKKLKEYEDKVGTMLNIRYKIGEIRTVVKDGYYHDAGMEIIDTMNKNEQSFKDVYCLTSWYFNDIFKDKIYIYNGEVYVEGDKLKVGEVAAYKEKSIKGVTILSKNHLQEHFIPLKKY